MTPFGSIALFRRDGALVFKRPRKERPATLTQARKAAMRFWSGSASGGDALVKVVLARECDGRIEVSERTPAGAWSQFASSPASAAREPHLAALLAELGIDPAEVPPAVPDVLIINGFTYRRDI